MTVHERIAQAMQEIAQIDFAKSGTVAGQGGGYKFIPISSILQAVRKAHAKAGVFLTIGPLEYDEDKGEQRWDYQRGGGSTWHAAIGHCEVTIHGADGDSITFTVPFEAQDNSDKLSNKIITNIERSAYRVLYAIDEGNADDPEATNETMPAAPTRAQKAAQSDAFFRNAQREEEIRSKALVMRPKLMEYSRDHMDDAGLIDMVKRYGSIDRWPDTIVVRAWVEQFSPAAKGGQE